MTNTPNMGLAVPTIGVDTGLTWEQSVNSNATTVDNHNHSAGNGVPVGTNGLLINADLSFNSFNGTQFRSTRYTAQLAPLGLAADIGCVYVSGVDLYYNDTAGNQIQITSGGNVNATSSGISSGTANASFSAGVLVVTAATNTPANIKGASILLGNNVANSNYLTLVPPPAMAASYALQLPTIPGSQSFLTIDTSGDIGAYASIAGGIVGSNITSNVNLAGKAVQESGKNVVVSNTNATNSLAIIRGRISSAGTIISGEGFSVVISGSSYSVTFTTPFGDTPAVTATVETAAVTNYTISADSTSSGTLISIGHPSGLVANDFGFIAIGQRA